MSSSFPALSPRPKGASSRHAKKGRPAPLGHELGATIRLAAPLAAAQLAQMAMGVTDTVLLGSLGGDALAAGGLGAQLYFTLMIVVQGGLTSVGILVAHARGAGDDGRIVQVLRGGFVLATLAALPPMLLLWWIGSILTAVGEPAALAQAIGRYDRVLLLAMPATMWMATQRAYLSAMGRTRLIMTVALVAVLINGFLNYGLIHGAFGLPRLGYIGSCTATAFTFWGMVAAVGVGMRWGGQIRRFRLWGPVDWSVVRELALLGWPIAITYAVEITLFAAAGLTIGLFGATPLAAHQISLNMAGATFMVPLALGQAANVRVGFHMGAEMPRAARRAGLAAFMLGVGYMSLTATSMLTVPYFLAGLYLDADVPANIPAIRLAVRLLSIAALFQVFDGAQTIAFGALRGLKDTKVPMLAAGFGYWGVGFLVAVLLAFPFGLGPIGIWWGLAVGLASAAILLSARFWRLSGRLIAMADNAGIARWTEARPRIIIFTTNHCIKSSIFRRFYWFNRVIR